MVHLFSCGLWRTALVFSIALLTAPRLFSQCNPDVAPPNANCVDLLYVSLDENGILTVSAINFNEGSSDNCCLADFSLRRVVDGPCDGDGVPDDFAPTITFCCADIGPTFLVEMRANDCAGNHSECQTVVKIEDKLPPILQAPPNVTVSCENFDPTLAAYGVAVATDNCCLDTVIKTANFSQFNVGCHEGTITRTFVAYDCSGNTGQVTQHIVVEHEQNYFIRFPDDLIVTDGSTDYGEPTFFGVDCELMDVTYQDLVFTSVPDADIKIVRTWQMINWCVLVLGQDVTIVPNPSPETDPNDPANLPGPIVSASGTAAPWAPTVVSQLPGEPPTDYSTYFSSNALGYEYTQVIKIIFPDPASVSGKVFLDTLDNCAYDNGEELLANWPVKITSLVSGLVYETLTDSLGEYTKELAPTDTVVEVTLGVPFNFGQNCASVYTLNVAQGQMVNQDIPAHLDTDCPLLAVDVSAPFLRRCFPNTYTVQTCNLSNATVADVHVEVALDSYVDFDDSSIPGTLLGGNTYSFELGDLEAGECTTFQIFFDLDCAAPIGYTHCTEAHVFPDTMCNVSSSWSGADLKVTGFCDGDSVRMTITNIGSGNMNQSQDFVVVEDVVMYMTVPFQLNSGANVNYAMPANGATWRVETDEVPNHPWGGVEAKAVEGCGGLNTTGLVTMFSLNTPNPFETVDCQENISSYDPNDKLAFPKGYGDEHFIEANTDLEYHIRFQNTGTDTAFTVVVLDTLSQYLEATFARPGASSHDYDFAVLDGNVLRFQFDNILLPDSNVNEVASRGFVKFRVPQKDDNANRTIINNRAAIYFDFNDPVLTNTTFHTIGEHFVSVSTDEASAGALKVYPNPSVGAVFFELPEMAQDNRFTLTDDAGKTIVAANFSGKTFRFEKTKLPPGVYFFNITTGNGGLFSGKVVLK